VGVAGFGVIVGVAGGSVDVEGATQAANEAMMKKTKTR
jgi:hypothetical protein